MLEANPQTLFTAQGLAARPTRNHRSDHRSHACEESPLASQRLAIRLARLKRRHQLLRLAHLDLLRQLGLAERVQRSLLPRCFPQVPGISFAAGYRPLSHIGGDFYNVFRLDRDRIGVYIGDVVGHGPAAALLSVFAMSTLRTKRIEGQSYQIIEPSIVLEELSHAILEADLPDGAYLTLLYGVIDVSRCTWTYCTGGHPCPILLRPGQPPVWFPPNAPLLGPLDLPFEQSTEQLASGDRLVLHSDGAETANWGDEGIGSLGLVRCLQTDAKSTLDAQLAAAMDVVRFDPEQPADDLTVLALEFVN